MKRLLFNIIIMITDIDLMSFFGTPVQIWHVNICQRCSSCLFQESHWLLRRRLFRIESSVTCILCTWIQSLLQLPPSLCHFHCLLPSVLATLLPPSLASKHRRWSFNLWPCSYWQKGQNDMHKWYQGVRYSNSNSHSNSLMISRISLLVNELFPLNYM